MMDHLDVQTGNHLARLGPFVEGSGGLLLQDDVIVVITVDGGRFARPRPASLDDPTALWTHYVACDLFANEVHAWFETVPFAGRAEATVDCLTPEKRACGWLAIEGWPTPTYFTVEPDRFAIVGAISRPLGAHTYVVDLHLLGRGPVPPNDAVLRRRLAEHLADLYASLSERPSPVGAKARFKISNIFTQRPRWRADVRLWGDVSADRTW